MKSEKEAKKIYEGAVKNASSYAKYGEKSVYHAYMRSAVLLGFLLDIDSDTTVEAIESASESSLSCFSDVDLSKIDKAGEYYVCETIDYDEYENEDYEPEYGGERYKTVYDVILARGFTDSQAVAEKCCESMTKHDRENRLGTIANYAPYTGEELIEFIQAGEFAYN